MRGRVYRYVEPKKYGFIKGDDGHEYFFHICRASQKHVENIDIHLNDIVEFQIEETKRGTQAVNFFTIPKEDLELYQTPSKVIYSKKGTVDNWEIIESTSWSVLGSSSESPEAAKQDAIDKVMSLRNNANAILFFNYHKTTNSEPGDGKSPHYHTIHHYSGRLATIARKDKEGKYTLEVLKGLEESLTQSKSELLKKTRDKKLKVYPVVTLFGTIAGLAGLFVSQYFQNYNQSFDLVNALSTIIPASIAAGMALHIAGPINQDSWLKKA
jgi:''Cold-shock'' DNA-binding domain.